MEKLDSQSRPAKLKEYGKSGLAVEFIDTDNLYDVETHDALVLIYRDKNGKVAVVDIEYEDTKEESNTDHAQ